MVCLTVGRSCCCLAEQTETMERNVMIKESVASQLLCLLMRAAMTCLTDGLHARGWTVRVFEAAPSLQGVKQGLGQTRTCPASSGTGTQLVKPRDLEPLLVRTEFLLPRKAGTVPCCAGGSCRLQPTQSRLSRSRCGVSGNRQFRQTRNLPN
ncbi:hypothetical protein B0T26DRAFT_500948 [Lasiosphaeria miniovina]|uniref:Uncharacterized protein n=1 Tax=Lasiosphaeria miniovina TaxID=1954250 RepID=A0AA39ZTU6_9PEZI|nr:uncharacterized protein B0T26DRAFT_500948 [Lasiosphaeria miniovina]KAK0703482.1 hypothetical protein B0T26DRAFT_500948 [Lasiosphaeria miniovina]